MSLRTYLKDRQYYEDRYDDVTVAICRNQEKICADAFHKTKKKLKPLTGKDKDKDPEQELMKVFNVYYYFAVEWTAGERWEKRSSEIKEMMAEDEAKDRKLAETRLTSEPICTHCGKTGLRIISKDLMHRGDDYQSDDKDEVLFMLDCTACKKRSAYWEDGTKWERMTTKCPKCSAVMKETSDRKSKIITTTYNCSGCGHSYKDKLDLNHPKKEEKPDPDYEADKKRFCFSDEKGRKYLEARRNWEEVQSILGKMKERQDNKEIYDAVKEMKKPKIAELIPLLSEPLEKAGYIEFHLDKPEMGQDVYVGFSCLDSKSDREDYDSRKTLKKLVNEALEDTNWRLMSEGISYRLGYLNGRVRAYEREEDLKKLVTKSKKLKTKQRSSKATQKKGPKTLKAPNGREIIL